MPYRFHLPKLSRTLLFIVLLLFPVALYAFQPLFDTWISYDVGINPHSVVVADLDGDGSLADSEVVTITVKNVNLAPVLHTIGAKSVNENQLLQFWVSATDPDGTVPTLSAVSLPTGATFVDSLNGAGSFAWTPSFTQAGNYNVTFIASDGTLADSEVVVITVNNVNRAPVLNSIGNFSINENQLLRFRISAADPDLTTPNFFAVDLPAGATLIDSLNGQGWFYWTPSFIQSGSYNVTFIASDGSLADSEVVIITVNNTNRAPILAPIGNKLVTEGQLLQFRVSASDTDGTVPNLSAINVPSGAVFVDSLNGAGSFSWTPSFTQGGIYNVTFIASDGVLADSEVVTITVNESDNHAPVLAPVGERSTTENQLLAFNISASDPDLTTPSLFAVGLPAGATFVDSLNGRGRFAWTPSFIQAGTYNVTFIAKDAVLADSEVVTITVLKYYIFAPRVDYVTGSGPVSVFASDLDADGNVDLIVAGSELSILKNNGGGTFADRVNYGLGGFSVFAADLDGNGSKDLVVTNSAGNGREATVSVLKNFGDGTFGPRTDYLTGGYPFSVYCSDLDGDGDQDIAVANYNSWTVGVLKNDGNGTFTGLANYWAGDGGTSIVASDLDGDGDQDLAVAVGYPDGWASVLKNNGNGTFAPTIYNPAGTEPRSIFAADLDGDSHKDLIVADRNQDKIYVFRNNGDGTFAEKVGYGPVYGPFSVFAADFDGDGDQDLATANTDNNTISIFLNRGDGTFGNKLDIGVGKSPRSIYAADLNRDGRVDLVTANFSSDNTVSVLLNLNNPPTCVTVKGDVNNDGNVTTVDVVSLINCVFARTGNCDFCFADVNCSADLSPADVVVELNAIFLGIPFPC